MCECVCGSTHACHSRGDELLLELTATECRLMRRGAYVMMACRRRALCWLARVAAGLV